MILQTQYIILLTCCLLFGCSSVVVHLPKSEPKVIDGVTMPRLVSANDVEYPKIGRKLDIEGYLNVKIHIGEEGNILEYEIVERKFTYTHIQFSDGTTKPVAEVFDPLAIQFIKGIVFSPAIKNGKPIDVWAIQPVRWKLNK